MGREAKVNNYLTRRQTIFVRELVNGRSATQAALVAYNTASSKVAAQIAYENLNKPDIKEAINWCFTHKNPDPVSIAKAFVDVLQNGTTGQRLEASIVYFKVMGLYPCPHN